MQHAMVLAVLDDGPVIFIAQRYPMLRAHRPQPVLSWKVAIMRSPAGAAPSCHNRGRPCGGARTNPVLSQSIL
jgi:hypothetical protein